MLYRKKDNVLYKKRPYKKSHSIIAAVIMGVILGLLAKLVDVPDITGVMPIFDHIFGRFGIWIFTATLLAVCSDTPWNAASKVFVFFVSMLSTYYIYTILFLGFFPKGQIILWGTISMISPLCAVAIWYANQKNLIGNILAALPIVVLCTEWYITARENILLLIVYLCMIVCLLIYVPKDRKHFLLTILITAIMTLFLVKTALMYSVYEVLLNI